MFKNCIMCESTSNLNTSMDILLDDKKYTILLCDNHAETTTGKDARESLSKRLDMINEVMEQAKALGLKIIEPGQDNASKISIVEQQEQYICECGKVCSSKGGLTSHRKKCQHYQALQSQSPAPAAPQDQQLPTEPQSQSQSQSQPPAPTLGVKSISGVAKSVDGGNQNVESYQTIQVDQAISPEITENTQKPEQQIIEVQEVIGRGGQPLILPKTQAGNIGTTNIKFDGRYNDPALQQRFKKMAGESKAMSNEQWHAAGSYDIATDVMCTLCRGSGVTKINGKTCVKCEGSGILMLDSI